MERLVHQLNKNELNELREKLYWELVDKGNTEIETIEDISNEMLFEHYEGIYFVEDDFFCNQ